MHEYAFVHATTVPSLLEMARGGYAESTLNYSRFSLTMSLGKSNACFGGFLICERKFRTVAGIAQILLPREFGPQLKGSS